MKQFQAPAALGRGLCFDSGLTLAEDATAHPTAADAPNAAPPAAAPAAGNESNAAVGAALA